MDRSDRKRVAVIGARGIGRHHAKWWHLEGAAVSAIVGTSRESNERTVKALGELFPFSGSTYTEIGRMLAEERPDIVDVCSPPGLHAEHALAALETGCDVLCEKPFYYDAARSPDAMVARARDVVARAGSGGRLLGMCAQFAIGACVCRELLPAPRAARLSSIGVTIVSPARGRPPDAHATWIDLGPHLLSVIQALVPGAHISWDGVEAEISGYDARVRVRAVGPVGESVPCDLACGRTTGEPANVRRLVIDGTPFDIEGGKDADGGFCARIVYGGSSVLRADTMRATIGEFLRGRAVVDGTTALANLEALLAGEEIVVRAGS